MAEHLVTLPAKQVAWVRFPVPDRPMFSVEKVSLFCNSASGGTFSSTAIEILKWDKKIAVAQAKVTPILRPVWRRHRMELFRQVCVKYRRTPLDKKTR
jgi:hypothetical protein